jgi:adenylate cyclase
MPLVTAAFFAYWGHMTTREVEFTLLLYCVPTAFVVFALFRMSEISRVQSFALNLFVRAALYSLLVLLAFLPMVIIDGAHTGEYLSFYWKRRVELAYLVPCIFGLMLLLNGIRGVSQKLGPGVLWNWIRGYYYNPKQEERIFMFLDMRDSTTLAEELGDLKFSSLVRDFLNDLTSPIVETGGEVSHYIGDEAVLTWKLIKGLPEANCIQCFFRMQAVLESRRDYYQSEYGLIPSFKAGAHLGTVVATEVGKIKSEIVFHGDVLNTAARVQSMCNELGYDFLITASLGDALEKPEWLSLRPVGEVSLKGKLEPVNLLAVTLS